MSLAEGVLQVVEDAAGAQGFTKVRTVRIEVGELAGVECEALRFCFDAVTRGSIAEGCALEIISVPGEGWCMQCAAKTPIHELFGACGTCGGHQVQAVGGREMRVRDILVD